MSPKKNIFNVLILAVAVAGLAFVFWETRRRWELESEYQQLAARFGEFPIRDPNKVYVLALPTDDHLHFRWRVYLPEKYHGSWNGQWIGLGHSFSSGVTAHKSSEFMVQVRFRVSEEGSLEYFYQDDSGSGTGSMNTVKIKPLVVDNWDSLIVDRTGGEGVQEFDADQEIALLEIAASPELMTTGKKLLPATVQPGKPNLFEYKVVPEKPTPPATSTVPTAVPAQG